MNSFTNDIDEKYSKLLEEYLNISCINYEEKILKTKSIKEACILSIE